MKLIADDGITYDLIQVESESIVYKGDRLPFPKTQTLTHYPSSERKGEKVFLNKYRTFFIDGCYYKPVPAPVNTLVPPLDEMRQNIKEVKGPVLSIKETIPPINEKTGLPEGYGTVEIQNPENVAGIVSGPIIGTPVAVI